MKKITLIRHAKSDWNNNFSDFDRPLNNRGLRDAPFMSTMLNEKMDKVDLIISSPANRAKTTCLEFAKEYNYDKTKIVYDIGIYEDGQKTILNLISNLNDEINSVVLFGHNPDITSTISYLSGQRFDNLPTCGIVSINFEVNNWKEIIKKNGKIDFFLFPKLYFKDIDFD